MSKPRVFVIFFVIIISLYGELCHAKTDSGNCRDISAAKKTITSRIDEINSYSIDAVVSINGKVVTSKIYGKRPNKLCIIQKIPKGDDELVNKVVYDNRYQWVETKISKKIVQVSKIELSKIVDHERPFDTGYYIMGTGLFSGEDFPSTVKALLSIYDLTAKCSNNRIILSGYLNSDSFLKYIMNRKFAGMKKKHGYIERFKKSFKHARLVFEFPNNHLREYSLGSTDKTETIKIVFKKICLNPELLDDKINYKPPGGMEVIDITEPLRRSIESGD
jgi:outer membrane lipoprotein-sorting protein